MFSTQSNISLARVNRRQSTAEGLDIPTSQSPIAFQATSHPGYDELYNLGTSEYEHLFGSDEQYTQEDSAHPEEWTWSPPPVIQDSDYVAWTVYEHAVRSVPMMLQSEPLPASPLPEVVIEFSPIPVSIQPPSTPECPSPSSSISELSSCGNGLLTPTHHVSIPLFGLDVTVEAGRKFDNIEEQQDAEGESVGLELETGWTTFNSPPPSTVASVDAFSPTRGVDDEEYMDVEMVHDDEYSQDDDFNSSSPRSKTKPKKPTKKHARSASTSAIRRHKRRSSSESSSSSTARPQCTVCHKFFTRASDLERHMENVHDETHRHCCAVCTNPEDIKLDWRNGEKVRWYNGEDQSCIFSRRDAMLRHYSKVHAGKKVKLGPDGEKGFDVYVTEEWLERRRR